MRDLVYPARVVDVFKALSVSPEVTFERTAGAGVRRARITQSVSR